VVELENHRIALAAVDTGMRQQVFEYEFLVSFAIAIRVRLYVRNVSCSVRAIPGALTFAAMELETECCGVVERRRGQDSMTSRALAKSGFRAI